MATEVDEIVLRIQAAQNDADLRTSGLLFHGTCEPFEGDLQPGAFDGVLWFADSPLIAQAYIPVSGAAALVSKPDDWRLNDRVRPDKHSFWTEFATNTMGQPLPDVEYDGVGQAVSWRVVPGWPTYAQCVSTLEAMGYDFSRGMIEIKMATVDGATRYVNADWLEPGRVYVTVADGLNLLDLSIGEGDLSDPTHKRIDLFRKAEADGFDGVIIDDFAQSDDCGNVGHRAIGLFERAVQRPYHVYPAVHRKMAGVRSMLTDDYKSWSKTIDDARANSMPVR